MKRLPKVLMSGLLLLLIAGCRTREERLVDAMDSVEKAMEKDMRDKESSR